MTKSEMVAKLSGLNKQTVGVVEGVINGAIKIIMSELSEGRKVQFVGFGTFEAKTRAPRKGHNPRTGEEIIIPGHKTPHFTPGKAFKEAVQ